MKKKEKNYKTLFIVCFSLLALNIIFTLVLTYQLYIKFYYIDDNLFQINYHIEGQYIHEDEIGTWEDANINIYDYNYTGRKFMIEKPNDWVFESATDYSCKNYNFCNDYINHIDVVFKIDTETTYDEFLDYLKSKVGSSFVTNLFYKSGDYDCIEYRTDTQTLITINLKQENDKVYMKITEGK